MDLLSKSSEVLEKQYDVQYQKLVSRENLAVHMILIDFVNCFEKSRFHFYYPYFFYKKNCQAIIKLSSDNHEAIFRQSWSSHKAIMEQSSGTHGAVIRQSLISYQAIFD